MTPVETKAYRAILPGSLSEDQLVALCSWARDNCWKSKLVTLKKCMVWIAIREKKRGHAQWARHIKQILDAFDVDTR